MEISFREFLAWEASATDAVLVRGTYVRLVGNFKAGALLGRIVYYYLPSRSGSPNKLRVKKDEHFWIAKTREEWQEEVHLTEKEFDRAVRTLVQQDLIEKRVFKFNGTPTLHIRLHTQNFLDLLSEQLESYLESLEQLDVQDARSKPLLPEPETESKVPESKQICPECSSTKVLEREIDPRRRCAYCLLRAGWYHYFPNKPQPRLGTTSLRANSERRWKRKHFRDNWQRALKNASSSKTCQKESWFDFGFFVRNDENYLKMLDNWMAWRDGTDEAISEPTDDGMRQM